MSFDRKQETQAQQHKWYVLAIIYEKWLTPSGQIRAALTVPKQDIRALEEFIKPYCENFTPICKGTPSIIELYMPLDEYRKFGNLNFITYTTKAKVDAFISENEIYKTKFAQSKAPAQTTISRSSFLSTRTTASDTSESEQLVAKMKNSV